MGKGLARAMPAQPSPSSKAWTSQNKATEQWESGHDLWKQPPEQWSSRSSSTGNCAKLSHSGSAVQPDSDYSAFGGFGGVFLVVFWGFFWSLFVIFSSLAGGGGTHTLTAGAALPSFLCSQWPFGKAQRNGCHIAFVWGSHVGMTYSGRPLLFVPHWWWTPFCG